MSPLRKLTLIALATLGLVAGTICTDDARAEPAAPAQLAPAPSAAPAELPPKSLAAPAPTKPSDELSDPLTDPAGTYRDLKTAKDKGGWVLMFLVGALAVARALTRIPGAIGAWFSVGIRGVIISAAVTLIAAAYDARSDGGSLAAVVIAVIGAALALWNPAPPTKEPPGVGTKAVA